MDLARPYSDVIPGPRGLLLSTLLQLEAPVTVRALARHAGVSPQRALGLVNELRDAGIVFVEPVGRALLVSLNRRHLAVEPLSALIALRGRLVERLSAELGGWPGLAGAWLFGSVARGDGGPDSDVDLLLVATRRLDGEDWTEGTARLGEAVRLWTGNPVQLVEHTRRSFAQLVKSSNPLIASLRVDGIPLTPGSGVLLRGAA